MKYIIFLAILFFIQPTFACTIGPGKNWEKDNYENAVLIVKITIPRALLTDDIRTAQYTNRISTQKLVFVPAEVVKVIKNSNNIELKHQIKIKYNPSTDCDDVSLKVDEEQILILVPDKEENVYLVPGWPEQILPKEIK